MKSLRLLPLEAADGATNMAADEALLEAAVAGVASLRFYTWSEPTLSLGYFQAESVRQSDPALARLPYVRRPSGGSALVHDRELTYCLALPAGFDWQPKGQSWLCRFHGFIAAALSELEIAAKPSLCDEQRKLGEVLCFLHHTPGDLILNEAKIAGSAQRKQRGALMQHGAILLAGSPAAPALPGLSAALAEGRWRLADALAGLDVVWLDALDPTAFRNINTPDDYQKFLDALRNPIMAP